MELGKALRNATERLHRAGVDSPALSARLLAGKALLRTPEQLLMEHRRTLTDAELEAFETLVDRREQGEPVAYLLGEQEFYGLPFWVTPDVLIPRPETELLVDAALDHLHDSSPVRFLDLGTGSGALAVALAASLSYSLGVGLDQSVAALRVAQSNARRNAVDDRLVFVKGDMGRPLPVGGVDLVVSNPPYVTHEEYLELSREVAEFEPRGALVSGGPGEDGLDHVRRLAPMAAQCLRPGGLLLVEIGWQQGSGVLRLFQDAASGFRDARIVPDLAGRDRMLMAWRTRD